MRLVQNTVLDPLRENSQTDAKRLSSVAVGALAIGMSEANVSNGSAITKLAETSWVAEDSLGCSGRHTGPDSHQEAEAWDALPAPALILIGSYLPSSTLATVRLVCTTWAAHLGELLKEAAPSTFPLLAYQMACKDGEQAYKYTCSCSNVAGHAQLTNTTFGGILLFAVLYFSHWPCNDPCHFHRIVMSSVSILG